MAWGVMMRKFMPFVFLNFYSLFPVLFCLHIFFILISSFSMLS